MDLFVDERKQELRVQMRDRLRALGPLDAASNERLQLRFLKSPLLANARCVSLYRSLPSEPQTSLAESALTARGVLVAYPVVSSDLPADAGGAKHERTLTFRAAHPSYTRGALGIEVPHADAEAIALDRIDLFVIPALACDEQGNRLGRGRGHYDATLAAHPRALRIALIREAVLVPLLPACDHDIPLDAVCTEARLLLCSERARTAARERGSPDRDGDRS